MWSDFQVAKNEVSDDAPLILVGSSMGGWISLKIGLDNPGLVSGLLLVAQSINFMWNKYLVFH